MLGAAAWAAVACGNDPRTEVLEERARWSAELLGWARSDDGIQCNVRLSGPVNAKLETLTVRFEFVDADGGKLQEIWHAFDVRHVQRGTPTELFVKLPADDPAIEQVGLELVLDPSPEQAERIVELPPVSDQG